MDRRLPGARTSQISITGYLVGNIWMPGAECWKHLNYDVTAKSWNWGEKGSLRDHVLAATNDGDFQSCNIACGELVITHTDDTGPTRRRWTRVFDLKMFPSIADCVHDDPDWFPGFGDDES